jgi:hypothetical protein
MNRQVHRGTGTEQESTLLFVDSTTIYLRSTFLSPIEIYTPPAPGARWMVVRNIQLWYVVGQYIHGTPIAAGSMGHYSSRTEQSCRLDRPVDQDLNLCFADLDQYLERRFGRVGYVSI